MTISTKIHVLNTTTQEFYTYRCLWGYPRWFFHNGDTLVVENGEGVE